MSFSCFILESILFSHSTRERERKKEKREELVSQERTIMAITGFSFDMASERELFARASNAEWVEQDEEELQMVALLRLSMQKHVNTTLVRKLSLDMSNRGGSSPGKKNKVKVLE